MKPSLKIRTHTGCMQLINRSTGQRRRRVREGSIPPATPATPAAAGSGRSELWKRSPHPLARSAKASPCSSFPASAGPVPRSLTRKPTTEPHEADRSDEAPPLKQRQQRERGQSWTEFIPRTSRSGCLGKPMERRPSGSQRIRSGRSWGEKRLRGDQWETSCLDIGSLSSNLRAMWNRLHTARFKTLARQFPAVLILGDRVRERFPNWEIRPVGSLHPCPGSW